MGRATTESAGVLLIDKPAGPTSHDVVMAARRALGRRRIGHAGTLDPFATGLLPLCLGPATRLAEYFHLLPKRYDAELQLGVETRTHDPEGEVVRRSESWRELTEARLQDVLTAHTGCLEQRPPAFSAKRVAGRRAHEAARHGEPLELEPVSVRISELALRGFRPPRVRLVATVSSGTYIRALARDLGRELGCFAHLASLRRTEVGPFRVDDAVPADDLERDERRSALVGPSAAAWWLSPARAVGWLPLRRLASDEVVRIRSGRRIPAGRIEPAEADVVERWPAGGAERLPVALVHEGGLVAIAAPDGTELQPRKVFAGE